MTTSQFVLGSLEFVPTKGSAPMFFSTGEHAYRVWTNSTSWRVDIRGHRTKFTHLDIIQMGFGVKIHQEMQTRFGADLDGWVYLSNGVTISRDPSGSTPPWMAEGTLVLRSRFFLAPCRERNLTATLRQWGQTPAEAESSWSSAWNKRAVELEYPAHRIVPSKNGHRMPEFTVLV